MKTMNGGNRMKKKRILIAIVSLGLFLAVSGQGIAIEPSGFITDMPEMKPDKLRPDSMIYRAPGVTFKNFTKFLIEPIEIWYADDSKYKGIEPDTLKAIADAFRETIVYEMEPDWPVVSRPGPGVMGMRIAITNVHAKKKKRGLLGYTPAGLVGTTAIAAAGKNMSLEDVMIEMEFIDGGTNERIGVMMSHSEAWMDSKKGKTSWEEVQALLEYAAKRIRSRIDLEHGKIKEYPFK
jgi:hypothetical protein